MQSRRMQERESNPETPTIPARGRPARRAGGSGEGLRRRAAFQKSSWATNRLAGARERPGILPVAATRALKARAPRREEESSSHDGPSEQSRVRSYAPRRAAGAEPRFASAGSIE